MKTSQKRIAAFAVCFLLAGTATARAQTVTVTPGGVTVKNPNGTTTRINNSGVATGKGAAVRQSKSVSISGNNRSTTIEARGGSVFVSGNHNRITVRGRCENLVVSGNDNQVTGLNVVALSVSGNKNHVYWQGSPNRNGRPSISNTGNRNSVARR